jgi:hypothetical protein
VRRAIALFIVLGCVVASALVAQRFLLLTPQQRAYWWPEAEAEILTPFTVTVPFTGRVLEPRVALVFVPGPRQPGQWMSVPVSVARYALRTLFPRPVLPDVGQAIALAAAAAVVLYLIVVTLARSIAVQSSRPKPTSLPGA